MLEWEIPKPGTASPTAAAQLRLLRLTHDELAVRPVALAGSLEEASPSDLEKAPLISQRGPFNEFVTPSSSNSQQWVVSASAQALFACAFVRVLYVLFVLPIRKFCAAARTWHGVPQACLAGDVRDGLITASVLLMSVHLAAWHMKSRQSC